MENSVKISARLWDEASAIAGRENVSIRSLIEEGLRMVITARNTYALTPFRLRDGSFQDGVGLQPGVDWKDLTSLAWEADGNQG